MRVDLSRRLVLGAGSAMGLLWLSGCNKGSTADVANLPLPDPAWPEPIKAPPVVVSPPPTKPGPVTQSPPQQRPAEPAVSLPLVGVLPRTRWTTAALGNPSNARPMNGVSWITVHHDGTSAFYSEREGDSISRLRSIRSAHMRNKARSGERWADIGYHYIIDRAGRVWEGRPVAYQGAHVQDRNENNIGVMVMGNFELQAPSQVQTQALDRFVAQLMRQHRVPLRAVRTHREWNPTECPGRSLQAHMVRTRARGGGMALAVAQLDDSLLA